MKEVKHNETQQKWCYSVETLRMRRKQNGQKSVHDLDCFEPINENKSIEWLRLMHEKKESEVKKLIEDGFSLELISAGTSGLKYFTNMLIWRGQTS